MAAPRGLLRRYTDLPSAINIVRRSAITLLPPSTWDDKNDRLMMETYKRINNLRTVSALCFSECAETYHHWKVFTPGASGICVEFHRKKLIDSLPSQVKHSSMTYLTVNELMPEEISRDQLPFIKRVGFKPESEFRIIYASKRTEDVTKDVPIPFNSISRIILNPWLHEELAESVVDMFERMAGSNDLNIVQSSLIDSPRWRRFADGYA